MGFAPVAAVAILFIAGLASFVGYNAHADAASDDVRRAEAEARSRSMARDDSRMELISTAYSPGQDTLTLTIRNTGSSTIDAAGIEVMLDGVRRTQDITWIRQSGDDRRYWPPLVDASIRLDNVASEPGRFALFTETGAALYGVV